MGRTKRSPVAIALGLVSCASIGLAGWPERARSAGRVAPPTTRAGITLVDEMVEHGLYPPTHLWTRLGDAQGRTVLVSDRDSAGVSRCAAECAREFPPLLATEKTQRSGDLSVIRRGDGRLQWAYQSQPLYTWANEEEPGRVANTVALAEATDGTSTDGKVVTWWDPSAKRQPPPAGWRVARFEPAKQLSLPDAIEAAMLPAANAVALTDTRGFTLYVFDGNPKRDGQNCSIEGCDLQWIPLAAAAMAANVGDFSVVTRIDGSKQWAYKGKPLYRAVGDLGAGDARGMNVDKRWHVAIIGNHFNPAGISITTVPGYGSVLSVNGRSLYSAAGFERRLVGKDSPGSFLPVYYRGKKLGERGCPTAQCLRMWHPFRAPADARSNGYWEVLVRSDGTRQWAYKGYALYTYAGDAMTTDVNGNDTYEYAVAGEGSDLKRELFLAEFESPLASGGVGVYWHIMQP